MQVFVTKLYLQKQHSRVVFVLCALENNECNEYIFKYSWGASGRVRSPCMVVCIRFAHNHSLHPDHAPTPASGSRWLYSNPSWRYIAKTKTTLTCCFCAMCVGKGSNLRRHKVDRFTVCCD